jgi:hypothetical protein
VCVCDSSQRPSIDGQLLSKRRGRYSIDQSEGMYYRRSTIHWIAVICPKGITAQQSYRLSPRSTDQPVYDVLRARSDPLLGERTTCGASIGAGIFTTGGIVRTLSRSNGSLMTEARLEEWSESAATSFCPRPGRVRNHFILSEVGARSRLTIYLTIVKLLLQPTLSTLHIQRSNCTALIVNLSSHDQDHERSIL